MFKLALVGLGGFIGAVARYGLSGLVHRFADGSFPTGTLVVNALGCLVMGGLGCLVEQRQLFTANTRLFLMIGMLGSFTTMSTVGYETVEFLRSGEPRMAAINAAANLVLGVAAALAGWLGVEAIGV